MYIIAKAGGGLVVKRQKYRRCHTLYGIAWNKLPEAIIDDHILKPDIVKWFNGGETMEFDEGKRVK